MVVNLYRLLEKAFIQIRLKIKTQLQYAVLIALLMILQHLVILYAEHPNWLLTIVKINFT